MWKLAFALTMSIASMGLSQEPSEPQQSSSQGQSIKGSILFVNRNSRSVFIKAYNSSVELSVDFATKLTSGGHPVSFQDLTTGQQVSIEYTQTGNRYVLTSLDVTEPILPPTTKKSAAPVAINGTITSIEPFNNIVRVLSNGSSKTLIVSNACKITGKQEGGFGALQPGAQVSIKAHPINGNQFDPVSIEIQ